LLNASVDVQRVLGRLRRPRVVERPVAPTPLRIRGRSAARQVRDGMDAAAATAHLLPTTRRQRRVAALRLPDVRLGGLVATLGHERSLALVVAGIVLGASVVSFAPGGVTASGGDTGGPQGDGSAPRLAVAAALSDPDAVGSVEEAYPGERPAPSPESRPAPRVNALSRIVAIDATDPEGRAVMAEVAAQDAPVEGPFLADGTLLKPVAVDTVVADGAGLIKTYKVKAGDTLKSIAKAHGVSMMTLWWANKLKTPESLRKGMELRIPPVSGLVVKVKAGETLEGLAKEHKVDADRVVELNGLEDTRLVVGQTLVLPGAKGNPLPTPKPTKRPSSGGGGGSSGGSARPPAKYSGGSFAWPAPGGSISQYYHYGHYGVDIDGSTGDRIVAAAGGTVTFAGWKGNGGGYQVWIAHGSGLYTTYNHMSSVSVGRGQRVAKGQRLGRMGATGLVTGSHLHFEVWRGPIWNGGKRVNPMGYF
jgi:murein DD-endopeptidase MepM/ murein hydrolase activator NlpD